MLIDKPNFEPPKNETQKNPEIKEKIQKISVNERLKLWQEIFKQNKKIEKYPYREHYALIEYTQNNKQDFINFLNKSFNKLEIA